LNVSGVNVGAGILGDDIKASAMAKLPVTQLKRVDFIFFMVLFGLFWGIPRRLSPLEECQSPGQRTTGKPAFYGACPSVYLLLKEKYFT